MNYKRLIWLLVIAVLVGATWWTISNIDAEREGYVILPDDSLLNMGTLPAVGRNGDWGYDQSGAFFVEYRLQRDRVRAQSLEMLEDILNNAGSSAETKAEAEHLYMEMIRLMEEELLVENLVKAQGYEDAVFFYRNRVATVLVKKGELTEREYIQITETVAGILGIERENIQVITQF